MKKKEAKSKIQFFRENNNLKDKQTCIYLHNQEMGEESTSKQNQIMKNRYRDEMIYTLQHCANNFENVDQIGDFLGKHAMRLTPVYKETQRDQ